VLVNHDRSSRHTHHVCYKRGCSGNDAIGCSCACDCSDDGVTFYGEEFGMYAPGKHGSHVQSTDPKVITSHKKLSAMGIAAMEKGSFNDGDTFSGVHLQHLAISHSDHKNIPQADGRYREHSHHTVTTGSPTTKPTRAPTKFPTKHPTATNTPTNAPTKEPRVDGIPVSRFSAWKCYQGYPAYGFRFRHHVHGSFESESHSTTRQVGDTSGYTGKLNDESFDGCLTHAIFHDLDKNDKHLHNNIGGITYWCNNDENVNKRCEIYTKTGEDQSANNADDGWAGYAVNAKMGGTLTSNFSEKSRKQTNHDDAVTCFVSGTDECVDSSCIEISLNDARSKYSKCGQNKHYTNNNKSHADHQPDHYDEDGNHI
jgi:hypothetical protein